MLTAFFVLAILGIYLGAKFDLADAIPLTIFSSSLIYYIVLLFGLGRFWNVIMFLIAICAILLIIAKRMLLSVPVDWYTMIAYGSILILAVIGYHQFICGWDAEMCYFLISAKERFFLRGLGKASNISFGTFASYTPIISVYLSLFMGLFGKWHDSVAYILNIAACYACLLPVLKDIEISQIKQNAAAKMIRFLFVVIAPYTVMECLYSQVTMEEIEVFTFTYVLCAVIRFSREQAADTCGMVKGTWAITISLCFLILTKQSAFVMVLVCMFSTILIYWKKQHMRCLLVILLPLAVYLSWPWYCKIGNLRSLNGAASFETVKYIFESGTWKDAVRSHTAQSVIKAFLIRPLNGAQVGMSSMAILMLMVIASLILKKSKRAKMRGNTVILGAYLAGLCIYLLGLWYTYSYFMSEYEREILNDFIRYMCGYLTAGLILALWWIFCSKRGMCVHYIALGIVLVNVNWVHVLAYLVPSGYRTTMADRFSFLDQIVNLSGISDYDNGEEIYFMIDGQIQHDFEQSLRYNMLPIRMKLVYVDTEEEVYDYLAENGLDRGEYLLMNEEGTVIEKHYRIETK